MAEVMANIYYIWNLAVRAIKSTWTYISYVHLPTYVYKASNRYMYITNLQSGRVPALYNNYNTKTMYTCDSESPEPTGAHQWSANDPQPTVEVY